MIVFSIKLAPGTSHEGILSQEILTETQAQIMTPGEAQSLGFQGFPEGDDVRLIVVTNRDAGWVEKAIERAPQVVGYDKGEVDM